MATIRRRFPRVGRALDAIGRGIRRVGGAFRRGFQRVRAWGARQRERFRQWRERRRRQSPAERQARARRETTAALNRSLRRALPMPLLRMQVAYLRVRWGWRTLAIRPAGSGRINVEGGFSPPEILLGTGVGWRIIDTQITLGRVPSSGREYQQGVMPIVRSDIIPGLSPTGRDVTFTAPRYKDQTSGRARYYESTLTETRVHQERGHRMGLFSGRPEMSFEVPQQTPGARTTYIESVNLIEVTQVTTFLATSDPVTHKRVQLQRTIWLMMQRYPGVPIRYHVIVPRPPDQSVLTELEAALRALGLPDVRFDFRIVGY